MSKRTQERIAKGIFTNATPLGGRRYDNARLRANEGFLVKHVWAYGKTYRVPPTMSLTDATNEIGQALARAEREAQARALALAALQQGETPASDAPTEA
jgi:hypothetical protein